MLLTRLIQADGRTRCNSVRHSNSGVGDPLIATPAQIVRDAIGGEALCRVKGRKECVTDFDGVGDANDSSRAVCGGVHDEVHAALANIQWFVESFITRDYATAQAQV